MSDLEHLRTRIRELDGAMMQLVADRMQLARRVGRIKRKAGIPLRDWEVERQVLDRVEARAGEHGLPASFARGLMQQIISESRATQEREEFSSFSGTASNIAVVGGSGRMGRWLVNYFRNQGHHVQVVDPEGDPEAVPLRTACETADVVMLAPPLEAVPATIEELIACDYRGIACDVASLKSHLAEAVQAARASGMQYTSLHPMFGPGVRTLSDEVIVLCDCGDAAATDRVRSFFAETAATLVELSFTEHDKVATYVLGLSHFVNIVTARTLQQSGLPYELLERIGSTTFHSQMGTTATVIREQPELYYQIQKLNAFSEQMYADFAHEAEALSDSVRSEKADQFVERMTSAREWMQQR